MAKGRRGRPRLRPASPVTSPASVPNMQTGSPSRLDTLENPNKTFDPPPIVSSPPVSSETDETSASAPSPTAVNWSTYASMVDPNEGCALSFIPTQTINGTKCAKLEQADIEEEISYWQSAVLCSVFGANPPFEVMKGFFKRLWSGYNIDKIMYVRKGVFLVRFENLQDKLAVEKRGFYHFDRKPLLVKGWNPNMDLQT